jgi:DNA-binding transcriptional LysR family regulator
MTLHQLRIFQAVAAHLSETRAAQNIHIRQPSVSKQLKLLEEELRVRLHIRKEQGIKLTDDGELFLNAIEPVLEQIDHVKRLFAEHALRTRPAFLRVGASQSPSALMLPRALNHFKKTHPHIQLMLRIAEAPIVEQMVVNREIELGVIANRCVNLNLTSERLCPEPVVAVVSSKHPLAKRAKVTPQELSKVPVVAKMGGRICDQLQKMGVKLNVSMQCEPMDAIKAAVESGFGMGFFYRSLVERDLKRGYLKAIKIPLLKEVEVHWFIIYYNMAHLSGHARDFLSLLHQMVSMPGQEQNRDALSITPVSRIASR